MKKIILILTAVYFLLGNCLLPQGDFCTIAHLPDMYQHCKTAEDPDMDLKDFVLEHLLNMGKILDFNDNPNEHELPHNPLPCHSTCNIDIYNGVEPVVIELNSDQPVNRNESVYQDPYFPQFGFNKVFQPPRV